MAIEHRLDHLTGDRLDDDVQGHRHDHQVPAGDDSGSEHPGRCRRQGGADVGHKAQDRSQGGPQRRLRKAESDQADPDHRADAEIDGKLSREIAGQALAGIIDRRRGCAQVGAAGQANQAIAQSFMFQQDEHQYDQHDAGRFQRPPHGREELGDRLSRAVAGLLDLHAQRGRRCAGAPPGAAARYGHIASLAIQPAKHASRLALHHRQAIDAQFPQGLDLGLNRLLILRQAGGDMNDLHADDRRQPRHEDGKHRYRSQHRRRLAKAKALQGAHQRQEYQTEDDRQGNGYQHFAADVEQAQDDGAGDDVAGDFAPTGGWRLWR